MKRFLAYFQVAAIAGAFVAMTGSARAQVQLMMLDEVGCVYCEAWTEEVGDAYNKSAEGQIAPLFRQNIYDDLPEYISLNTPGVYTPTFVLLKDGQEINRITGYPGVDFFWWMMEKMLADLPQQSAAEGS